MSDVVLTVIDRIRDLILADPAFDAVQVIYRGVPDGEIPAMYYPLGVIAFASENDAQELTGGTRVKALLGTISFNVLGRDVAAPVNRRADVDSYSVITGLAQAVCRLLSSEVNHTLGDLVDPEGQWAVINFFIGDGEIVYGWAEKDDRPNNYENYCIIPCICVVRM
jgi:hypothetical protein